MKSIKNKMQYCGAAGLLLVILLALQLFVPVKVQAEDWTEVDSVTGLTAALTTGGKIRLTGDIVGTTIEVPANVEAVIDLNGHDIDRDLGDGQNPQHSAVPGGYVIGVYGKLTVTDLSSEKNGKITHGWNRGYGGGGVYLYSGAEFTLEAGSITDNVVRISNSMGGGVYVAEGALFTMNGGEISYCAAGGNDTSSMGRGGAVGVMGKFVMNGGQIYKCGIRTAQYNVNRNTNSAFGGAVYVYHNAEFVMNGGSLGDIENRYGNQADKNGGAVYIKSVASSGNDVPGKFTFNGGTILAGYAPVGGGIYNAGILEMKDGAVIEYSLDQGSGVYNDGTFTMDGGVISNSEGPGVTVGADSIFEMKGGTISENANVQGGGVLIDGGTFNMSGNSVIKDNSAGYGGGGVCITPRTHDAYGYSGGGTFNMKSGTIKGNKVINYKLSYGDPMYGNGGGVWIGNESTFNLTGGSITGNKSTLRNDSVGSHAALGGGVYIAPNAQFNVSGAVTIQNNAIGETNVISNVLLDWESTYVRSHLKVIGSLAGSKIGITPDTFRDPSAALAGIDALDFKDETVFSVDYPTFHSSDRPARFFTADMEGYEVVLDSSGEAKLLKHAHAIKYSVSGNALTAACNPGCGEESTLTLNAAGGNYNGEPYTAEFEGLEDFNDFTGRTVSETDIAYFDKDNNRLEEAPVEIGVYTARYTLTDSNTEYTIEKDFRIAENEHLWGNPEYIWSDDNKQVTARRVCVYDETHVETETVSTSAVVTKPATCTVKGETTYTASFENAAFVQQTKTVEDIAALGHDWNNPEYVWSDDNSTVTATRICKNDANKDHVETEVATATSQVTKPATCTVRGETTYTAAFNNTAFTEQTKTVDNIDALGHDWNEPGYVWSDDNSTVTATRICKNDANKDHVETEEAAATSTVTKPATCTVRGETTYTASFENAAFVQQTKTVEDIAALGHDWDNPEYVWSDDNSTVTATRICKNDTGKDHTETETVNTTFAVTKDETCTEMGETTYTAVFENEVFEKQTKTIANIAAFGHAWEAPEYTWSDDNSKATAVKVCGNNKDHVETETADAESIITKPATCTEKGETTYSVRFKNEVFEPQTKTAVDVEALGHAWSEPEYTWSDDNSTVTAVRVCRNDSSHMETETANVTSEVTKPASCEGKGETTYTAVFTNEAFAEQTKTIADLDATGHDWGDWTVTKKATKSSEGRKERVCRNDASHVEKEVIPKTGDDSAFDKGASEEEVDKAIKSRKSDADPVGTVFSALKFRHTKITNNTITLKWDKVKGAKKYVLYGTHCGRKNKYVKLKTIKAGKKTYKVSKIVRDGKKAKLKAGNYYKFLLIAFDRENKVITSSKTVHCATAGGKVGNTKKVITRASAKKNKITLKVNKTYNLKAKAVAASKKLKVKKHRLLKYESTNQKIAVVDKNGKIKAKKAGKCYVFAYSQNGMFAKVKVTVK